MLYEGLKDNATIVIVPSTAVETMQLGGLAGMTALTMGLGQEHAHQDQKSEIGKQEGIQSMRDVVEPNGTKLIANP